MLLNPSHEITNAGLPADVQDRYVRYKQGSRAIVAWMTKYGPDKYKGKKQLPIKQAIALGRLLCDKKDEIGTMPSDIDYYFREVIKERAYLSTHFRTQRDQCEKDLIDTINHEHFTESMKQIHAILLTAGKPRERVKQPSYQVRQSRPRSSISSVASIGNSFSQLMLNGNDSDDEALSDTDTDATSECSHSHEASPECACDENEISTDFLDTEGEVGLAVEVVMFIDKLRTLVKGVRTVWEKSGRGDEPVAAAAAFTNLLLARARDTVREFSLNEPDFVTFAQLQQHIATVSCGCCDDLETEMKARIELLSALAETEREMGLVIDASEPVIENGEQSLTARLLVALRMAVQQENESTLTFDGIVCIDDLIQLNEDGDHHSSALFCVIVLCFIGTSHCAYSSVLSKPALIAMPRIAALKMANEALSSISQFIDDKSVFPCQCVNTLGFRVAQTKAELEAFARYRCWDVLMQSPITAGNHVLEILDLCSFYGMHLIHYRQYVAAVLHTYQALVSLGHLPRISVLEEVCEIFASVLYSTGARPESGFMACWLRYIGARLKFKNGRRHQNQKDTWCMSVPAHAAARAAGLNISSKSDETKQLPKFDYATIDTMTKLKHDNWILTADQSAALDASLQCGSMASPPVAVSTDIATCKPTRSKHKRVKSCQVSSFMTDDCCSIGHSIHACFVQDKSQGRMLPTSRLNLLALFHSMTRVVAGISDTTHADDSKSSSNAGRGQLCLCFVQTILRGADRIQDVRKRRGLDAEGAVWSKNERECVECFREHLNRVLADAKVLDGDAGAWLWTDL